MPGLNQPTSVLRFGGFSPVFIKSRESVFFGAKWRNGGFLVEYYNISKTKSYNALKIGIGYKDRDDLI